MKILVTGYTGQLGYDVFNEGLSAGFDMLGVGSKDLDITDMKAVSRYINMVMPDAIIHCAAYTGVDKAEEEEEISYKVNVQGTQNLVESAKNVNSKFMYISTDYVYDGEGFLPKDEQSETKPLGQYGKTKLKGEELVKTTSDNWFIIRTSWIFGINGNNFVKTMLRLGKLHNKINVVGDQFGSPTYTVDLAKVLIEMIKTNKFGIYNVSNEGFCSWADFAVEVFKHHDSKVNINYITTDEFPTLAKRPKNSRMSKEKLMEKSFDTLPSWQDAVARFIKKLEQEVD